MKLRVGIDIVNTTEVKKLLNVWDREFVNHVTFYLVKLFLFKNNKKENRTLLFGEKLNQVYHLKHTHPSLPGGFNVFDYYSYENNQRHYTESKV